MTGDEELRDFRGSARRFRKHEGLPGINTIGISNPLAVRLVNGRILGAHAIGEPADTPQTIASGYDRCLRSGCGRRWTWLGHGSSSGRVRRLRHVGVLRIRSLPLSLMRRL